MANETLNPGLVAVTDATGNTAGAIVWWRLSGELNVTRLKEAWAAAGLNEKKLPPEPSVELALSRAARSLAEKRRLVRPLEKEKGWAVVQEVAKGDELLYETVCTAKADKSGNLVMGTNGHDVLALTDRLRANFGYFQAALTTTDVGAWLTELAKSLHAVSLRDTGGVYFIPKERVAEFRTVAGIVRDTSSNRVYEVPALKSTEAIEAILAAVLAEAESEAGQLETELDTEELGPRALRNRAEKCDAMQGKLAVYEALLGRSLDTVRARVEDIKATVVQASLAAEFKENQGAAA